VGSVTPATPEVSLPWLSVEQMREVDRAMVEELGISLVRMMENAGRNLAILARLLVDGDAAARKIVVLVGRGGNGGGGLVAARHLAVAGADVSLALAADPDDLAPVTAEQLAILTRMGVQIEPPPDDPDLVVDAVLGYSQQGDPRGTAASLIEWSAGRRVLALDVPSGLELTTGVIRSPCIRAAATLTLALPKEGLRAPGAPEVVGDLYLADISVPSFVYRRLGLDYASPFGRGPIVRITG
jgi:NAD(P)H-hydrate epimerase